MHWEEEVPGWVYTFWKCKPVVCLSFCHFLPFRSHIISGIPLLKRKGFSNSPRSPVDHLFVTFLTVILSQLAWSGLSSCCGHCWRYSGPDCPPVVDLFLSTGLLRWLSGKGSSCPLVWHVILAGLYVLRTVHFSSFFGDTYLLNLLLISVSKELDKRWVTLLWYLGLNLTGGCPSGSLSHFHTNPNFGPYRHNLSSVTELQAIMAVNEIKRSLYCS